MAAVPSPGKTASPGSACAWDRGTMCRWAGELGATVVEATEDEAMHTAFCISTDATRGGDREFGGVSRSGADVMVDNPLQLGEGLRRCGPARRRSPGPAATLSLPAREREQRACPRRAGRWPSRWSGRHLPAPDHHTQRGAAAKPRIGCEQRADCRTGRWGAGRGRGGAASLSPEERLRRIVTRSRLPGWRKDGPVGRVHRT